MTRKARSGGYAELPAWAFLPSERVPGTPEPTRQPSRYAPPGPPSPREVRAAKEAEEARIQAQPHAPRGQIDRSRLTPDELVEYNQTMMFGPGGFVFKRRNRWHAKGFPDDFPTKAAAVKRWEARMDLLNLKLRGELDP